MKFSAAAVATLFLASASAFAPAAFVAKTSESGSSSALARYDFIAVLYCVTLNLYP
jgi:hypothetical protein